MACGTWFPYMLRVAAIGWHRYCRALFCIPLEFQ